MMSAALLRKRICNTIIASMATNNAPDTVWLDSQLDKIFASYFEERHGESTTAGDAGDENNDNVTPLMVACDKRCSEALEYLQNQIRASSSTNRDNNLQKSSKEAIPLKNLVEAWGHPTQASSCGNSAAHHALAVGFCDGLEALEYMWDCIEGESKNSRLHQYTALLSQTNQNGDTPLMMAVVSGHAAIIENILEHSLKLLALNTCPDDANVQTTWQSLKDIFNMRNEEKYTALNLACGHGHIDIVRFLIEPQQIQVCSDKESFETKFIHGEEEIGTNENNIQVFNLKPLIDVSYGDIDFCQKSVDDIAAGLKYMKQRNQQEKIKEFDDQLRHVRECLAILERELERISMQTANELLLGSNSGNNTKQTDAMTKPSIISNGGPKSKGKAKKKKKQKRNSKQNQVQTNSNIDRAIPALEDEEDVAGNGVVNNTTTDGNGRTSHKSWATLKSESDNQLDDIDASPPSVNESPFITLQDGSIVSKSQKSDYTTLSMIQADQSSCLDDVNDDAIISDKPVIIGSSSSSSGTKPKTLQSILQSTTSSIISSSSAKKNGNNDNNDDDEYVSAIMESLCLDPSMLLLSPHGMAMEMSPCQLDAIESILVHQLNATREARRIQGRLIGQQK